MSHIQRLHAQDGKVVAAGVKRMGQLKDDAKELKLHKMYTDWNDTVFGRLHRAVDSSVRALVSSGRIGWPNEHEARVA